LNSNTIIGPKFWTSVIEENHRYIGKNFIIDDKTPGHLSSFIIIYQRLSKTIEISPIPPVAAKPHVDEAEFDSVRVFGSRFDQ